MYGLVSHCACVVLTLALLVRDLVGEAIRLPMASAAVGGIGFVDRPVSSFDLPQTVYVP